MKITLTKIYRTNKDKQGNLLKSAKGFNYERLGLKTQEHGDTWLSGFGGDWNQSWQEGQTVDVEVKQVEKDGKVYLNFERINELDEIRTRLTTLEDAVFNKQSSTTLENDQELANIPF
jgi:hypothetical protein